jgi:carboxypeptidase PM20D1
MRSFLSIIEILIVVFRAIFPDATVAPFLFIAGTDSKHYTAITDHILRFMPIRMTPHDVSLPHNANERISLHAFK